MSPKFLRNFWVETEVEGRDTKDASGPKSKKGGFKTNFYVNENGVSVRKVCVLGYAVHDGLLHMTIHVDGVLKDIEIDINTGRQV